MQNQPINLDRPSCYYYNYYFMSGGYFVQNVPSFIIWIKYISIGHRTYKMLLGSEYPAIKKVGLEGQVFSVIAMAAMLVGYRLIAYTALMRFWCCKKIGRGAYMFSFATYIYCLIAICATMKLLQGVRLQV